MYFIFIHDPVIFYENGFITFWHNQPTGRNTDRQIDRHTYTQMTKYLSLNKVLSKVTKDIEEETYFDKNL